MVRRVVLVGLGAIGLLVLGGLLGWSGGYTSGLAAEGSVAPYDSGFFFGLGFLFKFLLVLFLFFLIGKLLFFWGWRRRRGYGGPGGKHWRHRHELYHRDWDDEERPGQTSDEGDRPQFA